MPFIAPLPEHRLRSPRRRLECALAAALAILVLAARPALADCQPDAVDPSQIVCTGTDADGFDGAGTPDLKVSVEDAAQVDNGGVDGKAAIQLDRDSSVTVNEGGSIQASGTQSAGIDALDRLNVTHDGSITVSGNASRGIRMDEGGDVLIGTTGTIDVTGGASIGVEGLDSSTVRPNGAIAVTGAGAVGIRVGDNSTVTNAATGTPTIDVSGGSNIAIDVGNDTDVTTRAAITVDGDAGRGIRLGDRGTALSAGSIDMTGNGSIAIEAGDATTSSGAVQIGNTGSITITGDDARAMSLGVSRSASSSGTIEITGDRATVFYLDDGSRGALQGTATVTGDDAVGFALPDTDPLVGGGFGQIDADATLTLNGARAVGVDVGLDRRAVLGGRIGIQGDDGIGVRMADGASTLQTGSATQIQVTGDRGRGIVAGDDVGLITNNGSILVEGADGIAIVSGGSTSGDPSTVANNGRIEARGDGGVAVQIGGDSQFQNAGNVIGGTGSGAAFRFSSDGAILDNRQIGSLLGSNSGVAVQGSSGSDTVWNAGRIEGDVQLGGGNDEFEVRQGGIQIGLVDGGTGNDVLRLASPGAKSFDLDGVTNFESLELTEAGQMLISGSGVFPVGVRVLDGTFSPRGVVDITGDYLQGADTGYSVTVAPDGTSDRLDVTGTVTIEDGAQLLVSPSSPIVGSASWTVLTATGGITGQFSNATDVELGDFLHFQVDYMTDALRLAVTRTPYTAAASNHNQSEMAQNLDAILAAVPTGDMADVLRTLDGFTFSEFDHAVDQMSPEIYDSQTDAALLHGRTFGDALRRHEPGCDQLAYTAFTQKRETLAPCGAYGLAPWAVLVGFGSRHDGNLGHSRYDVAGGGAALGLDWRTGGPFSASGGLAVLRSGIDFRDDGNGQLISFLMGARGEYERKWLRAGAGLTYGHGWHDTRRQIGSLQRRAHSDYESNQVGLLGDAGVPIPVGPVTVEPGVQLDYTYINEESFDESGAGSVNLQVDSRDASVFSTSFGVDAHAELLRHGYWAWWLEWMDGVWRPGLSARYVEIWTGADRNVGASFQGAPSGTGSFSVKADDADRGAEIGASLSFQPLATKATVGVSYTAFIGNGQTWTQRGTLDVRIPLP